MMAKKWKYNDPYRLRYAWNQTGLDRLFFELNQTEKSNTREVIDNELMAMDLLETLVADSYNKDAVSMLANIGIKC